MSSKSQSRPVTMREIAHECGVSIPVVSTVLNGNGESRISCRSELRERILRYAKKHEYRPNRMARGLRKSRHGMIGIPLIRMGNLNDLTLNFMLEEAVVQDFAVIVERLDLGGRLPRFLREHCVDGLVVFEDLDEFWNRRIMDSGIPTIWVNSFSPYGGDSILFDEHRGIELALAEMLKRGSRNFGLLSNRGSHYSIRERKRVLRAFCRRNALSSPRVHTIRNSVYERPGGVKAVYVEFCRWLSRHPDLDAVILSDDRYGPSFYRAARALGRRIPEDLQLVGYNDSYTALALDPELSSLCVDYADLGRDAIRAVSRRIANDGNHISDSLCPYRLVPRASLREYNE